MSVDIAVDDYRETLDKHRVEIVQCLDLDRQYVISHLRSKFIFDDEDCQIILNAGPSRQQKSQKFIDVLATKGPDAFYHFIDALEIEHPYLYEIFTGKKPISRANGQSPTRVIPWTVLSDRQLLDFDREYLVKEFQKASETNQSMAYMHSKLLQENKVITRKYEELLHEHEECGYVIEELQNELETKHQSRQRSAEETEDFNEIGLHFHKLMRDTVEKSNIIITLQARLLSTNEEHDVLKKNIDELRRKNADLMQQVRDLTINYDWQRTQSKRLSQQVDENKNIIQDNAATKKQIYELKFQLSHITEERDGAIQQLEEFKTVMAALNARHKILQQEKFAEDEKVEQVSGDFERLQARVKELENKLREESTKSEGLYRKTQRYLKEIEAHKEQRDFYLSEREHAIKDRDQVTAERDDTLRLNRDLKKSRDEAVQKQIQMAAFYQEQITGLQAELDLYRNEQYSSQISHILELDKNNITPQNLNTSQREDLARAPTDDEENTEADHNNKNVEEKKEGKDIENNSLTAQELRQRWRDRSKTEILQSAYGILTTDETTQRRIKAPPNTNLRYEQMQLVYKSLKHLQKSPVSEYLERRGLANFAKDIKINPEEENVANTSSVHNNSNRQNASNKKTKSSETRPRLSLSDLYQFTSCDFPNEFFQLKAKQRSKSSIDITATHRKLSRTLATATHDFTDGAYPLFDSPKSLPFFSTSFRKEKADKEDEEFDIPPRERSNDISSLRSWKGNYNEFERGYNSTKLTDVYKDFKGISL